MLKSSFFTASLALPRLPRERSLGLGLGSADDQQLMVLSVGGAAAQHNQSPGFPLLGGSLPFRFLRLLRPLVGLHFLGGSEDRFGGMVRACSRRRKCKGILLQHMFSAFFLHAVVRGGGLELEPTHGFHRRKACSSRFLMFFSFLAKISVAFGLSGFPQHTRSPIETHPAKAPAGQPEEFSKEGVNRCWRCW